MRYPSTVPLLLRGNLPCSKERLPLNNSSHILAADLLGLHAAESAAFDCDGHAQQYQHFCMQSAVCALLAACIEASAQSCLLL